MTNVLKTTAEIQRDLAKKIRELRLSQNITQKEIMSKTAASKRSIQNLELTGKASVETLVRVLKVLGTDCSEIVPLPTTSSVSPIDVFAESAPRQRARSTTR
jgi:transcriptional regulator with XRE-family HTH domain